MTETKAPAVNRGSARECRLAPGFDCISTLEKECKMNDGNQNNGLYGTVDQLSGKAKRLFVGNKSGGDFLLTAVVLLSGILSALFFWENSQLVFVNVWPPVAILLGLAVGLMPAEGAFFGWKRIRASKTDLTKKQVDVTEYGIVASVFFSIFSTLALFVSSFSYVPEEIKQYEVWLIFIALALPCVVQVAIYAYFLVEERSVVENHEMAKLSAMGFDAYIKGEQARIAAIIEGQEAALNSLLKEYGKTKGEQEANRLLGNGQDQLLDMGKRPSAPLPITPSQAKELDGRQIAQEFNEMPAHPTERPSVNGTPNGSQPRRLYMTRRSMGLKLGKRQPTGGNGHTPE